MNMHTYTKFKLWLSAPLRRAWALPAAILLCANLSGAARAAGEPPSTFGNTIGPGLLCIDQIDPFYFWSYMNQFFGPPYKREGGAYWFKVQGTLWGANITEVLVSDGANDQVFLAANFKEDPAKLSAAIAESAGVRHINESAFQYSPLVSGTGSKIVYSGQGSRIYCAKYNLDYMRRGVH
jgi:homoserine acetyltransferase